MKRMFLVVELQVNAVIERKLAFLTESEIKGEKSLTIVV